MLDLLSLYDHIVLLPDEEKSETGISNKQLIECFCFPAATSQKIRKVQTVQLERSQAHSRQESQGKADFTREYRHTLDRHNIWSIKYKVDTSRN